MKRLVLTLHPQDPCWELYAGNASGVRGLLGWVTDSKAVDAGVPPGVANLMCHALCASYMLTFFGITDEGKSLSDQWQQVGQGKEAIRQWLKSDPALQAELAVAIRQKHS